MYQIHKAPTESSFFSRAFLVAVLLGTGFLFFSMVRFFLTPVFLAAVLTILFYPFYRFLLGLCKNRKALASILTCLLLMVGLLFPLYLLGNQVAKESVLFYQSAETKVQELWRNQSPYLEKLKKRIPLEKIRWSNVIKEMATTGGKLLGTVINKTSKGTFQAVMVLFITLFTLFYFFIDGERLVQTIQSFIPLQPSYTKALFRRFVSVTRATVKGTILIGIIQGGLGGLVLWIFDAGSPLLWGVVMVIFAIIPVLGAGIILYPAGLIQIAMGAVWQGVAIVLITLLLISNIDNLLRPRLVGQGAGMHDLLIFFSTVGGIWMVGPVGFMVGPVITALFLTILEIYRLEFQEEG